MISDMCMLFNLLMEKEMMKVESKGNQKKLRLYT